LIDFFILMLLLLLLLLLLFNDREQQTLQSVSVNKQHYKRLSMTSLCDGDVTREHQ